MNLSIWRIEREEMRVIAVWSQLI